ncbi:MAG: hypothetical protein WD810_07735 [Solirubrobacterales bacterium]
MLIVPAASTPPLCRHDHAGTCWWCEGAAGSREHRYKATDLRREFSREEYNEGEVIVRRGDRTTTVAGPKAGAVKFKDVFCASCNNARSQPFDRAYDRLVGWFAESEDAVETSRLLPLEEIDSDWASLAEKVCRYFVKHIGCRIADCGFEVPSSFACYLDGGEFPPGLVLSFELDAVFGAINQLLKENPTPHGTSGNLFLGPITGEVTRDEHKATIVRSHWAYHALQLVWEWSAEGEPTGTNLDRPVVELPLVRAWEGAALQKLVARRQAPGVAGLFWRSWYRIRPGLALPALAKETDNPALLDLTGSGGPEAGG